jgi:hypothetical protein
MSYPIIIHSGEIGYPETLGAKIQRILQEHSEKSEFRIIIPERSPIPIRTGMQSDDEEEI